MREKKFDEIIEDINEHCSENIIKINDGIHQGGLEGVRKAKYHFELHLIEIDSICNSLVKDLNIIMDTLNELEKKLIGRIVEDEPEDNFFKKAPELTVNQITED